MNRVGTITKIKKMKITKKRTKALALMLSLNILFISCEKYDDNVNTDSNLTTDYSGEEIFSGLFFFQNDIAENISGLKDVKKNLSNHPNSEDVANTLGELSSISIHYIDTNYPNFFTDFEDVMKSGDLYKIEKKMNFAITLIEQSMLTSQKYSSISAISKVLDEDQVLKNEVSKLDLKSKKGINPTWL